MPSQFEYFNNDIQRRGILLDESINKYSKFARYGSLHLENHLETTREYIFFTKPDLHIFDTEKANTLNSELSNNSLFVDAFINHRRVLAQMQKSYYGYSDVYNNNPFMPLLSYHVRNTVDLPSIQAKEMETTASIWGTRLYYQKHSFESDENHEFTLEFDDTKDLEIYTFFKLWNEYENLKSLGFVTPPNSNYTDYKVLHDQIGIYKFIVDETGERLLYWAYMVGCYPKSVPRESFSELGNEGVRYNISWKATIVDDMRPEILFDFNKLVKRDTTDINKLYAGTAVRYRDGGVNYDWVGLPYIYRENMLTNTPYLLKWRER